MFFSSKHARCCFFFVRMVAFAQRRSNVSSQIAMSVSPSSLDGVGLLPPQCGQLPLQVDVGAGQLAPPASGGHATATASSDSASCNDLPSQISPHVIVSSETFASLLAILAASNVSSNDKGSPNPPAPAPTPAPTPVPKSTSNASSNATLPLCCFCGVQPREAEWLLGCTQCEDVWGMDPDEYDYFYGPPASRWSEPA